MRLATVEPATPVPKSWLWRAVSVSSHWHARLGRRWPWTTPCRAGLRRSARRSRASTWCSTVLAAISAGRCLGWYGPPAVLQLRHGQRALHRISEEEARQRRVALLRGAAVSPDELLVLTRAALAEAAAGRVKPVIGQTF